MKAGLDVANLLEKHTNLLAEEEEEEATKKGKEKKETENSGDVFYYYYYFVLRGEGEAREKNTNGARRNKKTGKEKRDANILFPRAASCRRKKNLSGPFLGKFIPATSAPWEESIFASSSSSCCSPTLPSKCSPICVYPEKFPTPLYFCKIFSAKLPSEILDIVPRVFRQKTGIRFPGRKKLKFFYSGKAETRQLDSFTFFLLSPFSFFPHYFPFPFPLPLLLSILNVVQMVI
jgi:hypothetical protein